MRRLLIRPGAIGDVITSLPAMESLRTSYTEVWAPSPVVPLIRFAGRVRTLSSTGIDLLGVPGQDSVAHRHLSQFDSIVSWYGTGRPEFRDAVSGYPFHFLSALPAGEHAVDFHLRQAASLGGHAVEAIPRLAVPRQDRGFCVLHPFSGSPRKNWPLAHYQQAAQRLTMPVQWCAGPEDALDGAVRIPDLWDLAQWLSEARLYIGNDSGITHLAAAVGIRVVAIFLETDPAIWAPRGPNVTVLVRPSVAELLAEANRD